MRAQPSQPHSRMAVSPSKPAEAITTPLNLLSTLKLPPLLPQSGINRAGDVSRMTQSYDPAIAVTGNNISASAADSHASPVNAMGSSIYLDSRIASPSNEFFGGSSAAYFMHQVKESLPRQPHDNPASSRSSNKRALAPYHVHVASQNSGGRSNDPFESVASEYFTLPTRDLADELMKIYWTSVHSLYPFLHRPSMEDAYDRLWMPKSEAQKPYGDVDLGLGSTEASGCGSPVFHCGLNIIFALSCQFAGPDLAQNCQALSETFFLRSRRLLHVDVVDQGSIALVQTLLIISQYLQCTLFSSSCWTALGLACRLAQDLGLYAEDPRTKRSPLELEIRRRIWYGCTAMDTYVCQELFKPPVY